MSKFFRVMKIVGWILMTASFVVLWIWFGVWAFVWGFLAAWGHGMIIRARYPKTRTLG